MNQQVRGVLGGRPIAIAYEDSAGNKDQAMNAARKLIGRDKVPLLLGPTLSNEMFAVGPVVNDRKIPIIGTSTTASGITAIGPWVFRTAMPESDVIPVTLKAAKDKLGLKKVVVMYANDDAFTKSAYDVMKDSLAKLGIETLATENFSGKDTDFTAQLTKAKDLNPTRSSCRGMSTPRRYYLQGVNSGSARTSGLSEATVSIRRSSPRSQARPRTERSSAAWFLTKKDEVNQKFVKAYKENTATIQISSPRRPTTRCISWPRRSMLPAGLSRRSSEKPSKRRRIMA
jgi:branched-chain amino acid transport system substrate-binding protein